ncbi:unnamed protein product [marine sediment metagenome]|uniref:Uncharacterized protein n=1 Tax=marine sediment metagenome TaxID=412755 RepID=X1QU25_9ZZZZ
MPKMRSGSRIILVTVPAIINIIGLSASPEPRNRLLAITPKNMKGMPKPRTVRYCVAKSIISGVAPLIVRIDPEKKTVAIRKIAPKHPASEKTCPATWLAASMCLSPKRRETRALMPTPVPTLIAITNMK